MQPSDGNSTQGRGGEWHGGCSRVREKATDVKVVKLSLGYCQSEAVT